MHHHQFEHTNRWASVSDLPESCKRVVRRRHAAGSRLLLFRRLEIRGGGRRPGSFRAARPVPLISGIGWRRGRLSGPSSGPLPVQLKPQTVSLGPPVDARWTWHFAASSRSDHQGQSRLEDCLTGAALGSEVGGGSESSNVHCLSDEHHACTASGVDTAW